MMKYAINRMMHGENEVIILTESEMVSIAAMVANKLEVPKSKTPDMNLMMDPPMMDPSMMDPPNRPPITKDENTGALPMDILRILPTYERARTVRKWQWNNKIMYKAYQAQIKSTILKHSDRFNGYMSDYQIAEQIPVSPGTINRYRVILENELSRYINTGHNDNSGAYESFLTAAKKNIDKALVLINNGKEK